MKSSLHVSLVLPAYNEAAQIRQCLEAIKAQSVMPYEVIVVDNNSTDDTVAIAREYPFVKVLREKRQGVLYARAKGFDAARGDLIGRIDVDTIIPENWIQTVREIFAESNVAATSGTMLYHDTALKSTMNRIELSFRRWLAKSFTPTETVFLQGASMAMRRDAWRAVRGELCERNDIHEDYDIALHLQQMGYRVTFDERLIARLSLRRIDTSFRQLVSYVRINPHTYRVHNAPGQFHMYIVIILILLAHFPVRLLYRGYDAEKSRFDLMRIFKPGDSRVNPFTSQD
jgi:glycosyltransferase involved in cell wall biosynthesis